MPFKSYLQIICLKTTRLIKSSEAYPLSFMLLGLMLGIVGYFENEVLVFLVFMLLFFRKYLFILTVCGIFGFIYSQSVGTVIDQEISQLQNTFLDVEATVAEISGTNDFSQTVTLKTDTNFVLLTSRFDRYPTLSKGSRLRVRGALKRVDEAFEGGYVHYLKSKKIFFSLENATFELISTKYETSPFNDLRTRIRETINRTTNEPEASLINGILLGEKVTNDKDLKNSLVLSGTSHIVSISGYNFSLIYTAFSELKRFINIRLAQILSIGFILSFMFVVGVENLPAQRATIMICFLACSKLLGRKANLWVLLLLSITLILFEFPLFYSNVSFQLTIFATVGLILITKRFTEFLKLYKVPAWLSESIGTTLAALIATLPISYLSFQSVSITGIISNIFILPLVPALTWIGILSAILGLFGLETVGSVVFHGAYVVAKLINAMILFFGKYPILIDSPSVFLVTLGIIIILLLFLDYYLHNETAKNNSTAHLGSKLAVR